MTRGQHDTQKLYDALEKRKAELRATAKQLAKNRPKEAEEAIFGILYAIYHTGRADQAVEALERE